MIKGELRAKLQLWLKMTEIEDTKQQAVMMKLV